MPRFLLFACSATMATGAGCHLKRPVGSVAVSEGAASPEPCDAKRVACAAGEATACAFVAQRCCDDPVGDAGESDGTSDASGGASDAGDGTPSDASDGCPSNPIKTAPGACSCDATDSDGDGAYDCEDECPTDPRKALAGICGCLATETDTDGNNVCDTTDPDILFWVDACLPKSLDTGVASLEEGAAIDA